MWVVNPKKIILSSSTHYQVVLNAFIQLKNNNKMNNEKVFPSMTMKGKHSPLGGAMIRSDYYK